MKALIAVVFAVALALVARADLPVHCLPEQIEGQWSFGLTNDGMDRGTPKVCAYNQALPYPVTKSINVKLGVPNVATDLTSGATGTWTLIYDQGFEVVLEGKKFFAFFNFTKDGTKIVSHCGETFTGWYHENAVNATNWGCFKGVKATTEKLDNAIEASEFFPQQTVDITFRNDEKFIERINTVQSSWTATSYSQFEGVPLAKLLKMSGKRVPSFRRKAHKQYVAKMRKLLGSSNTTNSLPDNFDWRTSTKCPGGCVTPVRNQGMCGSCFAFSSTGMFEARVLVQTGGKQKVIFSPQDDVNCDPYNQGCNGGFTYSVSKYGQDYGVGTDACTPYVGSNQPCVKKCPDSSRTYIKDYEYIGGFYGAANEQNMMQALYENGPISVDFEVYRDFFNYHSGVYHHVTLDDANPDPHFEDTNHAVLAVGYGVTASGEKYWIVKNSWGSSWGMNGYFWIKKGTDECGIESSAVQAFPITQ